MSRQKLIQKLCRVIDALAEKESYDDVEYGEINQFDLEDLIDDLTKLAPTKDNAE